MVFYISTQTAALKFKLRRRYKITFTSFHIVIFQRFDYICLLYHCHIRVTHINHYRMNLIAFFKIYASSSTVKMLIEDLFPCDLIIKMHRFEINHLKSTPFVSVCQFYWWGLIWSLKYLYILILFCKNNVFFISVEYLFILKSLAILIFVCLLFSYCIIKLHKYKIDEEIGEYLFYIWLQIKVQILKKSKHINVNKNILI